MPPPSSFFVHSPPVLFLPWAHLVIVCGSRNYGSSGAFGLCGVEDRLGVGGDLGSLADGSGVAGEVDGVDAVQFAGDGRPGQAGVVLRDADQDQGEEAQGDVGLDAVLLAVIDGADLEHGLQVPEPAFHVEQALEQAGGVRGGEVVVGAGQQVRMLV